MIHPVHSLSGHNNLVPFHLWWKELVLKRAKVYEYLVQNVSTGTFTWYNKKIERQNKFYKKEYYVKLFLRFLLKNFVNLHSWYILGYFWMVASHYVKVQNYFREVLKNFAKLERKQLKGIRFLV